MSARVEVYRLKSRLDATFARAETVDDLELQSDLARYLCILVSGYLEQATKHWLVDHASNGARPTVSNYTESQLSRFANANSQRLISLFATWDADWRTEMEALLVDERKDAVDSVVSLRNNIAHGMPVGVTLARIRAYYAEVARVVDRMGELCGD